MSKVFLARQVMTMHAEIANILKKRFNNLTVEELNELTKNIVLKAVEILEAE